MYEELKSIVNLVEGNEYTAGGVSYYIDIDKLDSSENLDISIKKRLFECEAIPSAEINMVITSISNPRDELSHLCDEWYLDEDISSKILSLISDDMKLYRCCNDYEYISKGFVGEIFRIMETGKERILISFYVVD